MQKKSFSNSRGKKCIKFGFWNFFYVCLKLDWMESMLKTIGVKNGKVVHIWFICNNWHTSILFSYRRIVIASVTFSKFLELCLSLIYENIIGESDVILAEHSLPKNKILKALIIYNNIPGNEKCVFTESWLGSSDTW